ncbi:formimidoylglutamate deiminase [Steroidobacter cummioxidans]|uniref:formimidoylglutamate deiminase n=1 Tax=Steroidobacter cummioxidans TaxID=1803913 RepID=UPI000E30C415|nr:formimidoylglutamate deiminase [Steroidobacter cummioxidans]
MTVLYTEQLLTTTGWVQSSRLHLDGARIAKIESDVAPKVGDERHQVIVPTMPNLHSHAFQRGMAGLAETRGRSEDNFWSWRDTMYRFASRMSPEHLQAIAAQAYVEMLEAGFGRVGEFHYLHHDIGGRRFGDPAEMVGRIAAAAGETGIALTLLPVFYAHASFGGQTPSEGQARFIHDVESYARLLERCREVVATLPASVVGVAPHSLRAVTPGELAAVVRMLPDAPVHIHIAEQQNEVRDCLAWSGLRPVRWLLDNAAVDSRWCLVHATHVDTGEIEAIARSGATVGLCPVTEANLGDGIFPAADFAAAGGQFGIGTDSNVCISLSGELSLLEYTQRLSLGIRNVIGLEGHSTGMALYRRALSGGGRALGAPQTGLIEGAAADLVSLSRREPAMICRSGDALIDSWLFATGGGVVDCVWVSGVKQIERGRHRSRDSVRDAYERTMQELCA